MIEFYNATKSGVDNMDHMVRFYSSKRKTRRWFYSFFMNLVDIIALNAFVAYKTGHPQESRYLFLKKLSHQLLMPLMEARRTANSRLPKTLVSKINLFLPATSSSEFQSNLLNATRKIKDATSALLRQTRKLTWYVNTAVLIFVSRIAE